MLVQNPRETEQKPRNSQSW